MAIPSQSLHMLEVHLLIEELMLRQFPSLMGLSILLRCSIPRSFRSSSSSSNQPNSRSKFNMVIKIQASPVVPHHPRSICRITHNSSSRGHMAVVSAVGVEACRAFLHRKTAHHSHQLCSSLSSYSRPMSNYHIKLAN